jgi:pyrimidine operon attenuation protein/uracil phosphoribosyltransferase
MACWEGGNGFTLGLLADVTSSTAKLHPSPPVTRAGRQSVRFWEQPHAARPASIAFNLNVRGGRAPLAQSSSEGPSRVEILSAQELRRTLDRLASQILESASDSRDLLLLGIPTRGVALAQVLAERLGAFTNHPIPHGSIDPTFHRDDLARVGTRLVEATSLPASVDGRLVVLVDDVIYTGRTVRAALEALQAWGRPRKVELVVMVDRGHRELPIQPDFCGRVVPTSRHESIQLCLQAVDGQEGVFLLHP